VDFLLESLHEKDEDYYKASVERLENAKAQMKLF
jgi:hypothetical protein